MHIIYSDRHREHRGEFEFYRGEWVPCFETPERADFVLAALQARALGPVRAPELFSLCERAVRQAATQPGKGPGR